MLDLATALAQSRHVILHNLVPLFSSPSRPCPRQPKHTGKLITNTTITIGPHSFARTKLFLIQFDPNPEPDSPTLSPHSSPVPPSPKRFTPTLIARLNALAAQDDRVQSLISRATDGEADQAEVVELGQVIDRLKREETEQAHQDHPVASTSRTHGTRGKAQREPTPEPEAELAPRVPPYPAVLIEFAEAAGERYLLPSHYSYTLLPDGDQSPSDVRDVRLECFVRAGQAGTSVLDDQRPFGKGKGREVEGELVPVMIEVADCSDKARQALLDASRTGRNNDRHGTAAWETYVSILGAPPCLSQRVILTPNYARRAARLRRPVPLRHSADPRADLSQPVARA